MPQSLLAQYIKGIKKPSITQTQRILKGVQAVDKELSERGFALDNDTVQPSATPEEILENSYLSIRKNLA